MKLARLVFHTDKTLCGAFMWSMETLQEQNNDNEKYNNKGNGSGNDNDNSKCNDKTIKVVFHPDKTVCIRSNLYHCQDNDNDNSNCNCKCKTSFPNRQNTPHQVRSLYFVFVFVLCICILNFETAGCPPD